MVPGHHHLADPAGAKLPQLRVPGSIPLRHVDRPLQGVAAWLLSGYSLRAGSGIAARHWILTVTEDSFPALIHAKLVRSAADVAHDVLDAGVVLKAVHGQVLAVPGMLEPAVRHLRHDRDVGVDPHRAEVQALGHPHGAAVVLGPHARGEPVLDAVCPADGLVLVGEALDGDDRPHDLVPDHLLFLAPTPPPPGAPLV